jgi:CheY-like chemotaxis protein
MSEIDCDQSADRHVSAKTILVVDDDKQILHLVATYLCRLGYTVLMAESGTEGISLAETHPAPIHLLLVDVNMPGMSGFEFANYLANRRTDVHVIYMSGVGEAQALNSLLREVEFLLKPFSLADLAHKAERLLKREK